MLIHTHSYSRAALIGNPSDGYFGKTIAFTFSKYLLKSKLSTSTRPFIRATLETSRSN
jgi:glucuronokinase